MSIAAVAHVLMTREETEHLSARQLSMLVAICERRSITIRALAPLVGPRGVSKPAVTRGIDALEELGLVKRHADPADQRSVLVKPEPNGIRLLADLNRELKQKVAALEKAAAKAKATKAPAAKKAAPRAKAPPSTDGAAQTATA